MNKFDGFPSKSTYTSIPNAFFSRLLPEITDLAELKTTLHVMTALYAKKGYPHAVNFNELMGNAALMASLKGLGEKPQDTLVKALAMGVERGTFASFQLFNEEGLNVDIYFLNDEAGREAIQKIISGELDPGGLVAETKTPEPVAGAPDVFTLYEQNIGMLTPMVADELRDAEANYPAQWLRDAIKEAALHNKRNIKYISKILENWSVEGRSDGTYQRDSKKAGPDKYFKGKYGHMVQH
jgi:DNA replication protein